MRTALEVQLQSEVCGYLAFLLDRGVDRDCVTVKCRDNSIFVSSSWLGQTVTRWIPFTNEMLESRNRQPFIENMVDAVLGRVVTMSKAEIIFRREEAIDMRWFTLPIGFYGARKAIWNCNLSR